MKNLVGQELAGVEVKVVKTKSQVVCDIILKLGKL